MADDLFIARAFRLLGAALAVLCAVLWFTVPIRPMFPPYLATAVLALGYSSWCRGRPPRSAAPLKS
jgi:hypothetical protein